MPTQVPNSPQSPPVIQPEPEKTLLAWTSPSRIYHKHTKEFYTSLGTILFLVCVVLLFLKQIGLILALISFGFFLYVIDSVKPENVEHRLTNKGIFTLNKMYFWDQLGRFWIDKEYGKSVLYIENLFGLPSRLPMILADQKPDEIEEMLKKYLIMQKPEPTQVEKWGEWLSNKIILEKPKTNPQPKTSKTPHK